MIRLEAAVSHERIGAIAPGLSDDVLEFPNLVSADFQTGQVIPLDPEHAAGQLLAQSLKATQRRGDSREFESGRLVRQHALVSRGRPGRRSASGRIGGGMVAAFRFGLQLGLHHAADLELDRAFRGDLDAFERLGVLSRSGGSLFTLEDPEVSEFQPVTASKLVNDLVEKALNDALDDDTLA